MADIHNILQTFWGHERFRPMQEEIIRAVLQRKDTLALLPTGGGKSICFQVPALALEGLCIVISPLIALMKDQVENLRKKNITALAVYSGMTRREVINTLRVAANSNCKFLYVSPERLETNLFQEYLPALPVNLVAVDEAHCISQWGYDFRPAYLRIRNLRESIPDIPFLALTASATPLVQEDICRQLLFKDHSVFRQSFERSNLSYSVFEAPSKINKVLEILKSVNGSSIIYCRSRKKTKQYADLLNMHQVKAGYYHAGLSRDERNTAQEQWLDNTVRTIVCTNAFGMGIDKPDVRVVIHLDVPDCLENYYQEAGRAGRGGQKSYAVLLYHPKELDELQLLAAIRYPEMESVRSLYEQVMNYLQVASGTGEGQSFDFDFGDFIQRFKIGAPLATYGIKTLEHEELLVVNDQVFQPSKVEILASREDLLTIEAVHPLLTPVLQTLLRTYEGIVDQPVSVHEKTIAFLLKKELSEVIEALQQLQLHGILRYERQKEKPQLFLLQNRVKTVDLMLDGSRQKVRRDLFLQRVQALLLYINNKKDCRSTIIGRYFGDNEMNFCGKCDNCLERKKQPLSKEEFEEIHQTIMVHIGSNAMAPKELLSRINNIKKEKAWEVIQFLESENKIIVDEAGAIRLKA